MKKRMFIGFGILLLLCLILIMLISPDVVTTTEYIIESDKIEEEITIVQISDLHNEQKYITALSSTISEIQPDYVVITGDFIDYYTTDINVSMQLIDNIQGIAPIYFVQGNHEYFSNYYEELKQQLIAKQVVVLEDEIVETNNLNIVGLLNGSTAKITVDNDKFTLLLAHRPELFENYVSMNADLVLSGHTHGGQICLPLIGGLYAPNQGFFPEYVSGLYIKCNTKMIISKGIGNGKIPVRFLSNPEIIVVRLK